MGWKVMTAFARFDGNFAPNAQKSWKNTSKNHQKVVKNLSRYIFQKTTLFTIFDSFLAFFHQGYVLLRVWPKAPNTFLRGHLGSKLAKTLKNAWKITFTVFWQKWVPLKILAEKLCSKMTKSMKMCKKWRKNTKKCQKVT